MHQLLALNNTGIPLGKQEQIKTQRKILAGNQRKSLLRLHCLSQTKYPGHAARNVVSAGKSGLYN